MKNTSFKLRNIIAAMAAVVCLAGFVNEAHAETVTGYICKTRLFPGNGNSYGEAGFLRLYLYSDANCSGTSLGYKNVYSVGGTYSDISSTYYLYSEAQLMALYRNSYDAAVDGVPVVVTSSDATNQGFTVIFNR